MELNHDGIMTLEWLHLIFWCLLSHLPFLRLSACKTILCSPCAWAKAFIKCWSNLLWMWWSINILHLVITTWISARSSKKVCVLCVCALQKTCPLLFIASQPWPPASLRLNPCLSSDTDVDSSASRQDSRGRKLTLHTLLRPFQTYNVNGTAALWNSIFPMACTVPRWLCAAPSKVVRAIWRGCSWAPVQSSTRLRTIRMPA